MQPTLVNPYDFQKIIDRYARDIKILWNPGAGRFQVFETIAPVIELGDVTQMELRKAKIRPLFMIQTPDGGYRDPDMDDVARVVQIINTTIEMNTKGVDFMVDQMEKADIEREESVAPGVKDAMDWGAKEMYRIRTQKGILGFK